ncbi:glycosyltransferase [Flavivirga sp. 57AJ16]|uniref:glycosyltransferase n=1 Tax=Flavivirga sp. 57AJ16 TaxID=3025307 RepID=UPI0023669150|nr:glycosyltransferase [Flavivirga sp. 57AJ16]MDD7885825.1 glycosyltransferase [Flavivirga sp. 57AJ16]
MKNILLIMPYGSVGGMERLALTFYNHYKKEGYQVKALKFIKLNSDIINFGEDELFFKPYDFNEMSPFERMAFYLKAPLMLRKIIKENKTTHSIAFGDMANLFSSLTFTNEFKIGSIHALKSVEFVNKTFFNSVFKLSYKTSYKYINKVVCISQAIKNDLINNYNYKFPNLEIVYNPHNVKDVIRLSSEPITEEKEKEIFSKKTIVFLGRLSIQKSPWHLINAFSMVKKIIEDVNLVIIGDGDIKVIRYIEGLIKEAGLQNNVFLLGRKSNPYKYLAAANVLALSSHYEGTPNVIVESIATETPIVSSYCTKGIIELMSLKNYEEQPENIILESGIVTPNLFKGALGIPEEKIIIKEEEKFSNALVQVLENTQFETNLKEAKDKLLSKFDLDFVANKYLEENQ